jgi:hypothetical protein
VRQDVRAAAAVLLAAALLSPAPAGSASRSRPDVPTPVLLERAVARGQLDRAEADLYLAYALTDPSRVPPRWRSRTPWEGTSWLLDLRDRLVRMPRGEDRAAIREALGPDTCDSLTGATERDTPHFHIHYPGPSTTDPPIENYQASLEATWATEVDAFGWAAPPLPPSGKYLVVVFPLGSLFGFVSPTGPAPGGNNPNTAWNEGDAMQSCMVLNSNYSTFAPSTSQQALDSTTAHEFNHSIQFGYGTLDGGPSEPDNAFVEGMATWMEDEVFDGANDNYRYLWPDLADDMGQYRDNNALANPYAYWVVWRAMLERFGTGVPGGGEDVVQRFWELTSQNQATTLEAMDRALGTRGIGLAEAHLASGVALRFNRPCGGGYVPPYCLEESSAYVTAKGPTTVHGQIVGIGGSFSGAVLDNYALNWIDLPSAAGPFQARLRNASGSGGRLKAAVVCDTGTGLRVTPFPQQAGPEETVVIKRFDTAGCESTVAIVANVAQTAANPSSSESRPYQLTVVPPAEPTKTTLRVKRFPDHVVAKGTLSPPSRGDRMRVRLFERDGRRWDHLASKRSRLLRGRRYRAEFDRPQATRCRIEARFPGDAGHLPSQRSRTFAC